MKIKSRQILPAFIEQIKTTLVEFQVATRQV